MIVRLMVIDPMPDAKRASDVLVYQVPENSREFHLLAELFNKAALDWTVLTPAVKMKKEAQ